MTREEREAVMEVIKSHMDGEDKNTKAVLSDVIESINELETLEQEPCDDVVSREKVLEMITDFATLELYIDKHNHVTFEPLEKLIKSLPSVTQSRRRGHWIVWNQCSYDWTYKCSECEKIVNCEYNYCPNCGADMRGEK